MKVTKAFIQEMLRKLAILKWRIEYEFWERVYEWKRNREGK